MGFNFLYIIGLQNQNAFIVVAQMYIVHNDFHLITATKALSPTVRTVKYSSY